MNYTCGHCCWWSALYCLAWLLISSGLLVLTWNKVIAAMAKVKPAKYWQALLLLTTLVALCAPQHSMRRHFNHHHCGQQSCKDKDCDRDGTGKKEDCPYSKKSDREAEKD